MIRLSDLVFMVRGELLRDLGGRTVDRDALAKLCAHVTLELLRHESDKRKGACDAALSRLLAAHRTLERELELLRDLVALQEAAAWYLARAS